ncbi:MAG: hypothetical protein ACE5DS_04330 [Kiloniellaceae bacterium]
MGRLARLVLVALLPWLAVTVGPVPAPARAEEDCKVLLARVSEMMSEDSAILARVRDKLERAAELCAAGENEAAVRLLREITDAWMPMGMGN